MKLLLFVILALVHPPQDMGWHTRVLYVSYRRAGKSRQSRPFSNTQNLKVEDISSLAGHVYMDVQRWLLCTVKPV